MFEFEYHYNENKLEVFHKLKVEFFITDYFLNCIWVFIGRKFYKAVVAKAAGNGSDSSSGSIVKIVQNAVNAFNSFSKGIIINAKCISDSQCCQIQISTVIAFLSLTKMGIVIFSLFIFYQWGSSDDRLAIFGTGFASIAAVWATSNLYNVT